MVVSPAWLMMAVGLIGVLILSSQGLASARSGPSLGRPGPVETWIARRFESCGEATQMEIGHNLHVATAGNRGRSRSANSGHQNVVCLIKATPAHFPFGPVAPTEGYLGLTWDDAMNRMGHRSYTDTVRDSVWITPSGIEAIIELTSQRPRTSKNGPVESRNHLEDLSPSLRGYVLDRCRREGIPVTSVRVVSSTEVIIP
jgi:hypothetical protein